MSILRAALRDRILWNKYGRYGKFSEYCKLCFEKGNFAEPKLTLAEMIGRSIANMVDDLDMDQEEAERLANATIPNLKRWQKTA